MEMKYREKKKHICDFIMKNGKEESRCGLEFTSENRLKEHKRQAKHLLRQKRRKATGLVELPPKKQLRIDAAFSVPQDQHSDTDDKDSVCKLCNFCYNSLAP